MIAQPLYQVNEAIEGYSARAILGMSALAVALAGIQVDGKGVRLFSLFRELHVKLQGR